MRNRRVAGLAYNPLSCAHRLQVNVLRFILADILEAREEWDKAARVLMGISLDAGQRYATPLQHSHGPV